MRCAHAAATKRYHGSHDVVVKQLLKALTHYLDSHRLQDSLTYAVDLAPSSSPHSHHQHCPTRPDLIPPTPPHRTPVLICTFAGIADAYHLLSPSIGDRAASTVFAIGLLASGQSSTITGTPRGSNRDGGVHGVPAEALGAAAGHAPAVDRAGRARGGAGGGQGRQHATG